MVSTVPRLEAPPDACDRPMRIFDWAPVDAVWRKILGDNPARLYGLQR